MMLKNQFAIGGQFSDHISSVVLFASNNKGKRAIPPYIGHTVC